MIAHALMEQTRMSPSAMFQQESTPSSDDEELCRRAVAAYFQRGGIEQPIDPGSVVLHHRARYVVLRKATGVLAVFQVMASGSLQQLREWPRAVEAATETQARAA